MASVKDRIARVFKTTDVDALLLMNTLAPTSNFLYLTGLTGGLFEFNPLIVTKKREILLTNPLEYEIARRLHPKEMEVRKMASIKETYLELHKRLRGKTIGIDGEALPEKYYRILKKRSGAKKFVDVSHSFYSAREIKGKDEIAKIAVANHIILKIMDEIPAYFKEGMTEKQLAARVEYLMRDHGADGTSFSTIVCFGENSALPHHAPTDLKLRKNSFVLIDCGAKHDNYCSDVTRTFIFKPDKKSAKYRQMNEMLGVVANAQKLAMGYIRDGLPGKNAHLSAEEYINSAFGGKYRGAFIHGLGHPLGIDVHDLGPRLSPLMDEKLCENMVTSNEPGIYIVGFGGVRIEDDVIVTKKGGKLI